MGRPGSPAELAAKTGIDAEILAATLAGYNAAARAGRTSSSGGRRTP